MDHIPRPSHPFASITRVPCLSGETYDGGDFQSYPARRGFDPSKLTAGDFTEHSATQTAAFLQDWLYFGTLFETLGLEASKTLFTTDGYVNTAPLEDLIHQQILRIHQLVDEGKDVWPVIKRTEACLGIVSYYCCLASPDQASSVHWPLTPEIDASIRVLGQRIANAHTAGLGNIAGPGFTLMGDSVLWLLRWPSGSLVVSRLQQQQWCPSDIDRALEQFSASTMYYMSQLAQTPSPTRDHSRCTSHKCLAFQVNEDTYQTQHTRPGCTCGFLGPDIDAVVKIIEAGKIPLLTLDIDDDKVRFIVEPHYPDKSFRPEEDYDFGPIRVLKGTRDYVAISHVWADGLGNAKDNALPYCQLRKFKTMLDELRDQKSSLALLNMGRIDAIVRKKRNLSLRFWMDTLCVPVAPTLKHIRKKAIRDMTDVYRKSQHVLVIDRDLQNVSSADLDLTELFMRISLSGWMRRLWTLQEGVLGEKLQFKVADRILDIQQLYGEISQNDQHQHRRLNAEQAIARQLAGPKGTPRGDSVQFLWRMRALRANMFTEDEAKSFGYRITVWDAATSRVRSEHRRMTGIMAAFEAARYRTTSRAEDVFFCLGSLLGWSGVDLGSVPLEKRLRLMLEGQTSLPQGIIFVPGQRNQELGWRWAVTGFDNDMQTNMEARIDDIDPAVRDDRGLTVKYPGLVLSREMARSLRSYRDIVVASVDGDQPVWWHVLLLEDLAPIDGVLSVLYYSLSRKQVLHRQIPMAAAVIAIDPLSEQAIYALEAEVTGSFQALATVQLIGTSVELETFLQRRDCNARKLEETVGLTTRSWLVQ